MAKRATTLTLVTGTLVTGCLVALAPAAADSLRGDGGRNLLAGGAGRSEVSGLGGDDTLFGDPADVFTVGAARIRSTSSLGTVGNSDSFEVAVAPAGRVVAFTSFANNLVPGDTGGFLDVFVKDFADNRTTRVSAAADGTQGNGPSASPSFGPGGRSVAFDSGATNLVAGDTNGVQDVFLKTLASGAVQRVSLNGAGAQLDDASFQPVVSPDGTMVAFRSFATNAVAEAANGESQIYVKTLATGAIRLVSASAAGVAGDDFSSNPRFSPDGTRIIFESFSSNLVAGDTNGVADVFVKTLASGAIERVSLSSDGGQANGASLNGVFSPNGRDVAFESYATNLVAGDSNNVSDVFVKNLATGAVFIVSTGPDGALGPFDSAYPDFAPDGKSIAFVRISSFDSARGGQIGPTEIETKALDVVTAGLYVKDLETWAVTLVDREVVASNRIAYTSRGVFLPSGREIAYDRSVLTTGDCTSPALCVSQVETRNLSAPRGAADRVLGGTGNDWMVGGPGDDVMEGGKGDDVLLGGPGDDVLRPGPGVDDMDGGPGNDTADYTGETRKVVADLRKRRVRVGGRLADRIASIENLTGGRAADTLTGNGRANVLSGGPGNDTLRGLGGPDVLEGGPGNDILDGGRDGVQVIDTATYHRATGPIRLDFARGRVTGGRSVGADRFTRSSSGPNPWTVEAVVGTRFDDVLDGGSVDLVRLEGGPGDDRIVGSGKNGTKQRVTYRTAKSGVFVDLGAGIGRNRSKARTDVGRDTLVGIDMVTGSRFDDILVGNDKGNVFNGDGGADRIEGRGGPDEFNYLRKTDSQPAKADVILDFSAAEGDFVDLSALGVTRFVKGSFGTRAAKEVRLKRTGKDGVLEIDLDADRGVEMRIFLKNLGSFGRAELRLSGDPPRNRRKDR